MSTHSRSFSIALFTATMGLATAGVFAAAQPAPNVEPAAPATTTTPATPPACADCPHKVAGAQPSTAGANQPGMMQPGKAGMMQHGMMMQHGPKPERHARFHDIAALADVKVQKTKFGAVIQLVAKKPADTAKVQELAIELTTDLTDAPPDHRTHAHAGPRP